MARRPALKQARRRLHFAHLTCTSLLWRSSPPSALSSSRPGSNARFNSPAELGYYAGVLTVADTFNQLYVLRGKEGTPRALTV